MDKIFLKKITIDKVRHLNNIVLNISDSKMKHIIFTGKNGSGKTSLLDSMANFINSVSTSNSIENCRNVIKHYSDLLCNKNNTSDQILKFQRELDDFKEKLDKITKGIDLSFNYTYVAMMDSFHKGEYVIAYYKAERIFKAAESKHVEKIDLGSNHSINATPKSNFIKYIVDLKVTEALAKTANKNEQANLIASWFEKLEGLLQDIYTDKSLKLVFDMDTFNFTIHQNGREPYGFNTMSSGYAAVFDVVLDLIMRMESQTKKTFNFNLPGIVLIDEIETHLHLELQKRILPILTTIFPNVQFIISTHSPFVLNALDNVVIYDLEKNLFVNNGLTDLPYDGIVEGYFDSDKLSQELRNKFDRYKLLVSKEKITDDDFAEVQKLELYLDEIPDYLALPITTEYEMLKENFRGRGDL